jgi:hypothetical protein
MRTIVNTEKRCPVCTNVFRVLDDAGEPLPAEQREWDRVKAPRYRGGYRWRDRCRACFAADRMARYHAKAAAERERQPAPVDPLTLSARQAAQLAGVSASTVVRAKAAGQLPRKLTPAVVEAWARRRGES